MGPLRAAFPLPVHAARPTVICDRAAISPPCTHFPPEIPRKIWENAVPKIVLRRSLETKRSPLQIQTDPLKLVSYLKKAFKQKAPLSTRKPFTTLGILRVSGAGVTVQAAPKARSRGHDGFSSFRFQCQGDLFWNKEERLICAGFPLVSLSRKLGEDIPSRFLKSNINALSPGHASTYFFLVFCWYRVSTKVLPT